MSALAGRKIANNRRKGNFKELNNIKLIDFGSSSKDILQLVKENILADDQSNWKGSELIFLIPIAKNNKPMTNFQESNIVVSRQNDRYLVILRKPGENQGAFILKVIRKENDVVVKAAFNIGEIRSIDYGSDELELALSFEALDTSLHFGNQADRDETLFIIAQVAKFITGSDPYIGYSVDLDAITYMMTTSSAPSKFPALQRILKSAAINVGDQFSIEEAEAEHILDDLNWGNSVGGIEDIHQLLSRKSQDLNHEIIDFLLQWEEMDEVNSNGGNSSNASRPGGGKVRLSLTSQDFGLKDTGEVLKALSMVDSELSAVDKWLGEQIEHMAEIQSNLHMIEDESGTIESSWQSLTVVEKVLQTLLERFTIDPAKEALLLAPDKSLAAILKSVSLRGVDVQMKPFLAAVKSLRDSLVVRISDLHGLSSSEWKHIQNIQSVRAQRDKLVSISEAFCTKIAPIAIGIFDWLLKHKTLVEGDTPTATIILPKSFSTRPILDELCFSKASSGLGIDPQSILRFLSPTANQLLESQIVFHTHLEYFMPLVDLLLELKPNYARPICEAYISAAHDRMYFPLFRMFLKDVQSHITQRPAPLTLANCDRFRCDVGGEVLLRFDQMKNRIGQPKMITAWKALQAGLMIVAPVIEREEMYIKKTFRADGRAVSFMMDAEGFAEGSPHRTSKIHDMIDNVFDGVASRFLKLTATPIAKSNANEFDGIEAIAMLAVIREFSAVFLETGEANKDERDSMSESNSSITASMSSFAAVNGGVAPVVGTTAEESPTIPRATYYVSKLLASLTTSYENIINHYTLAQNVWINAQKADPKSPAVLVPFYKFPTLVQQILEMTNGQTFACVEDILPKMAKELFLWLNTFARQHDKYTDKIKIANLAFFRQSIGRWQIPSLQSFVASANQQIEEAEARYIHWMVEYEFPSLSALAMRMDGVGSRVTDEELSVYIRRKDVLNVIKELEHKAIDSVVAHLRKRLEKHFKSEFDDELQLIVHLWAKLKDRMVGILSKLDAAASVSYQIQLEINPRKVAELFDKHQNGASA